MNAEAEELNRLAKVAFNKGDYAEAARLFNKSISIEPGNKETEICKGIAMAYESATDLFMLDVALESYPRDYPAASLIMDRNATDHMMYQSCRELIDLTVTLLDEVLLLYKGETGAGDALERCVNYLKDIKMVQESVVNVISDGWLVRDLPFISMKNLARQWTRETDKQIGLLKANRE